MRVARGAAWQVLLSMVMLARAATGAEHHDTPHPFAFSDQSPTVGIYGLPHAQGYSVARNGEWRAGVQVDYTSHFRGQVRANEQLLFDGETTRAALIATRGFEHRWQISIEIPFVDHSGGFSDGFIEDFHDAFGFGDGGRTDAPRDRQQFVYERDGTLALDVSDSPSGLGDVRLGVKKRLAGFGDWGTAISGELKLPTGDADRLTGSGATDVALWASVGNNQDGQSNWRFLLGAGGLYTGKGDVLEDQRVETVGFGWASIGYALTRNLVLQVQADTHSAFYDDTGLKALNGVAVQGALGFDWQVSARSGLDFALIEDLNTGASPDVSFAVGLRHGF